MTKESLPPLLALPRLCDNPFRMLGLSRLATRRELQGVVSAAQQSLRLDLPPKHPIYLPWLEGANVTNDSVEAANRQLIHPESRIAARLFWFSGDRALASFEDAHGAETIFEWARKLERIAFREGMLMELIANLYADPKVENLLRWASCLNKWAHSFHSDSFWADEVVVENRSGFEPPASVKHFAHARKVALDWLLEPFIDLANAHFEADHLVGVRHIHLLFASLDLLEQDRFRFDESLLGNLISTWSDRCGTLRRTCWDLTERQAGFEEKNRDVLLPLLEEFDREIVPAMQALESIFGSRHLLENRIRADAAEFLFNISRCLTWANSKSKASEILLRAMRLSKDTPFEERLQEEFRASRTGVQ